MTAKKLPLNAEKLLGISAMLISFITLLIFIWQTNLMRRQNYISIMPYLMVSTTNDRGTYTFAVNLKNHGVGPAIVESAVITYKGKRYDLNDYNDEFFKLLRAVAPALDSIRNVSSSTLNGGIAIPANSTYNMLEVSGHPTEYELMTRTIGHLLEEGLNYEIVYRSIQDERWMIRNGADGPEALD